MTALAFLTSLGVGLVLQPFVISWLRDHRVLDVPNPRSSHSNVTPRGGGIGVAVSFGVGLLLVDPGDSETTVILGAGIVLGSLGLADDLRGLTARVRLGALVVVGAVSGLFLAGSTPILIAIPLMSLWTAAYVNAFNFMDGINGVSGLTAIAAGVSYALIGLVYGPPLLTLIGAALAGSSLSFLPYNLVKAHVFLGDVGSYFIGFVIAACAFIAWISGVSPILALAPTLLYMFDTGSTLFRRLREGSKLTEAHRDHVYQRLAQQSKSHLTVAFLVFVIQCLVTLVIWYTTQSDHLLAGVLISAALLSSYVAAPAALERRCAARRRS